MAMKFARMMCGSKEARAGGRISPSKFLDRKSSHRSSEGLVGPTLQYTWQTNLSRSLT